MLNIMKNERGFAVVYGLVVLLLASITGTGFMLMTMRSRIGSTDHAIIRSASQAAVSGLKACEAQFLNDPDTALAILNKYIDDNDYRWLLGTATNSNTEQRIQLGNGSGSPEYSARILGFDETNYFIKIESTGYGGTGGKKRAVASYHLGGLGQNDAIVINHALFLGGRLQNVNKEVSIKGDVYLRMQGTSDQHFNSGGTIDGNLKTGHSTALLDINKALIITGTAFFQCRLSPQGSGIDILGKAGFTGGFQNFNADIRIYDDAYFISPYNPGQNDRVKGQSGKTVTYSSPISDNLFTGFGTETQDDTQDSNSIAVNLGTTADTLVPLDYDPPTWESGVVEDISGSINGSNLESYWADHEAAGTLYQGEWLVLNMTGTVNGHGGTFTKKSIWITNNNNFSGDFYCGTSTTLFIVNESSGNINMKMPDNCNFTGLIYVNTSSNSQMNFEFGDNSIFYGAIHFVNGIFNLNSGNCDSVRIYCTDAVGQSALQEILNTGIIKAQGAAGPSNSSMVLIDKKIRPTLLGMQL
ncbi:MAG: hypothetical protein PVI26_01995 [Chitinispirillia bacterium]|jgi:hypothetical protein